MTPPFSVDHPTEGRIDVITTVTLQGTQLGSFNANGELTLNVTLRFSHRNAATGGDVFGAGPSIATFDLHTGASEVVRWRPSPEAPAMDVVLMGFTMRPDGQIKIVDNATFRQGFLDGADALLDIEGPLSPIP